MREKKVQSLSNRQEANDKLPEVDINFSAGDPI
jgi:hypothetical protein